MLFKNRLEIWNSGRLPSGLPISKLYEPHSSIPANPLIAEQMYRAGYIEKAGTMINGCREAAVPEPAFSSQPGQFIISFKRKSSLTDQVTPQVTPHVTGQNKVLLSSIQSRLIVVLDGEKPRSELMAILNLKDRKSFMSNYIDPAIASGFIEMTIPESPNSSKQKYRLTTLGKRFQKKLKTDK